MLNLPSLAGSSQVANKENFKAADKESSKATGKEKFQPPLPVTERPMPKKQGSWWIVGKTDPIDTDGKLSSDVIVAKTKIVAEPQPGLPSVAETGKVLCSLRHI